VEVAQFHEETVMGKLDRCSDCDGVRVSPADIVRRQVACWDGMTSDSIQLLRHQQFEYQYKAPCHLLIMSERAEREQGETVVEGLPKSTLHALNRKLTFVPAGHEFHGWQVPRTLTRATYFYIDPSRLPLDPGLRFAETEFKPRLFFFDQGLWETLQKLKAEAENADRAGRGYAEALGLVLAHELIRLNNGVTPAPPSVRGGLAAWQQKRVAEYVEEHLADEFSLSALAELAGLSPFHFSRAFKQSFGLPPHRYLSSRRIDRAKDLLVQRDMSVTQIGVQLGFSDSSSFSTSFHKHTGTTPTAYRRDLE
jgi:AraC family transcriptional regulator